MILLLLIQLSLSLFHVTDGFMLPRDNYPQIISHRGASGYIPEHSLAAYQTAIDLQTDYVEPDLVVSKDGTVCVLFISYYIIFVFRRRYTRLLFYIVYMFVMKVNSLSCMMCCLTIALMLHHTPNLTIDTPQKR